MAILQTPGTACQRNCANSAVLAQSSDKSYDENLETQGHILISTARKLLPDYLCSKILGF
jgi:hypothetical protein